MALKAVRGRLLYLIPHRSQLPIVLSEKVVLMRILVHGTKASTLAISLPNYSLGRKHSAGSCFLGESTTLIDNVLAQPYPRKS
jgi:hypothetical protein